MTESLTTSEIQLPLSEKKLRKLMDQLTPVFRRHLKTKEAAQRLIESPLLVSRFDLLIQNLMADVADIYMVSVDYTKDLREMIKDGNYDSIDKNITTSRFPFENTGRVDLQIILIYFNRYMSNENVLREMDMMVPPLRPATLPELLAFGRTYPDRQCYMNILALGSKWLVPGSNPPEFPVLGPYGFARRRLSLRLFTDENDPLFRFAAVRK
jgi:hypothetical protein